MLAADGGEQGVAAFVRVKTADSGSLLQPRAGGRAATRLPSPTL